MGVSHASIPRKIQSSVRIWSELFFVPFNGKNLAVCASVDTDDKGIKWEHVSVGLKNRLPTCAELQFVKMLFWDHEDEVIQFFMPQSKCVKLYNNCVHLWRPINIKLPWE